MLEVQGKFTSAKIFTDNVEQEALSQIYGVCSHPSFDGHSVRIMPDVHAGKGCVIGFTSTYSDTIIPNLIGVDIGCGMLTTKVKAGCYAGEHMLSALDKVIHDYIPTNIRGREKIHRLVKKSNVEKEVKRICDEVLDEGHDNHLLKIGSLGGGNHFVEGNIDEAGNFYLVIHSGSRNFGHKIATHYQKKASHSNVIEGNKELAYLSGTDAEDYLRDMRVALDYAQLSRMVMMTEILDKMGWEAESHFETLHNYISKDGFIRKGAVEAREGQQLLIPLNMRDGSLLCIGKGNEDWNYSAPHGAGRLMSRSKAKKELSMEEFEKEMSEVYTTCVHASTLDESPMAYKDGAEIMELIGDTAEIVAILKPLYNFKG